MNTNRYVAVRWKSSRTHGKTTTSNDLKTITTACRRMIRRVRRAGILLIERVGRGWRVRTWFGIRPPARERALYEAYTISTVTSNTPWGELEDAGLLEEVREGVEVRPRTIIPPNIVQLVAARRRFYVEQRARDTESSRHYRNLQRIYAQEQQLNRDHPIWETPTHRCLRDGSLWKWEEGGWVRLIEPPSTTPHIPLTTHPTTIGSVSCPTPPSTPSTTPYAH